MPSHTPMKTTQALQTLASAIKAKHLECQAAAERSDTLWEERSKLLNHSKSLIPHGQWIPWVHEECGFSERQAQRYMLASNASLRESYLEDRKESNAKHRAAHKARGKACAEEFIREAKEKFPEEEQETEAALEESDNRQEMASKLVEAGYRTLAKQLHPDVGGSHEAMTRLTDVRNTILSLIRGAL